MEPIGTAPEEEIPCGLRRLMRGYVVDSCCVWNICTRGDQVMLVKWTCVLALSHWLFNVHSLCERTHCGDIVRGHVVSCVYVVRSGSSPIRFRDSNHAIIIIIMRAIQHGAPSRRFKMAAKPDWKK